jgi:hypothetical protein
MNGKIKKSRFECAYKEFCHYGHFNKKDYICQTLLHYLCDTYNYFKDEDHIRKHKVPSELEKSLE